MMIKNILTVLVLLCALLVPAAADSVKYVNHDLKVSVNPETHSIRVTDTLTLPRNMVKPKVRFLLHGNLTVTSKDKNIKIIKEKGELKSEFFGINTAAFEIKKKIPLGHYSLQGLAAAKTNTVTLVYEGKIHHPIVQSGAEYARGFSETPGIIDPKGAYLAGASFWVPWFNNNLVTFTLQTDTPGTWDTVAQGKRTNHEKKDGRRFTTWDSPEPMDEVYLIAAAFNEYDLKVGKVNVMAFLRTPDEGLANKYLETTGQYLEMYESLIGAYPYSKFALIENFWETGYGMPSFTLLGSKIIRFPFILHSSYPHELLHNYWGNSVFVDYEAGNWCEGLTVYLADHLIKQRWGRGADYRKTTLQGYTHYAAGKKEEFPLTRFKARHNALSSSIGYGKSMMVFHMLRQALGDKWFKKTLQHFYKNNKYKRATFDDFRASAEAVSNRDLTAFFQQWITRTGVPELKLSNATLEKKNQLHSLSFTLEQVQKEAPYTLRVPVAFYLGNQPKAEIKVVETSERKKTFTFTFGVRPVRIEADPQFDVGRKLHQNEIPATLSSAFGAEGVLILLPSKAPESMLKGYAELADTWAKESKGKIQVKKDSEITALPPDKAVWLMGHENLHAGLVKEDLSQFSVQWSSEGMTIAKKSLPFTGHSIVAAVKNRRNHRNVVVLLSSGQTAAMPGLARKLPHYGKYSYLAFEGDEPTNMLKGNWPAVNSPMAAVLVPGEGETVKAKLPKETPLGNLAPLFSSQRMVEHIKVLAADDMAGRGLGTPGLEKAGQYIADAFKKSGLKPGGDKDSYFQTWEAAAGKENKKSTLRNVIGVIPGKNKAYGNQSVILCAHYDHLGRGWPDVHKGDEGKIHPGADDNASGVAVMLEMAHVLGKSLTPERSIIFIAFTGEESGLLGSKYFVNQLKTNHPQVLKGVMGVVNMDTVGRLDEGEKLLVIGASSANEWKFIFMGITYTVGVESQLVTQPLDASDQVSFIREGVPGIQLFSGPHTDYHRPGDTVNGIKPAGLIKVASAAREAVVYLSERKNPMTFKGTAPKKTTAAPSAKGGRRVRTGIMPDFGFSGKGMKVGMVSPASPAQKAGLKKGDLIIKVGDTAVSSLKEYSDALKTHKPGDTVMFTYTRDNKTHTTTITLQAR